MATRSLKSARLKSARDLQLPVDLIIEIFSRVPAKSIARFRCLSKFWKSILGGPYFKELFLTKSVARPRLRLYFTLTVSKKIFSSFHAFSAPQPQNPDENSSVVATPYKAFPKHFPTGFNNPQYGLVFLKIPQFERVVIWNPITGESVTLPEVGFIVDFGDSHFGFDPINKQFKIVCTAMSCKGTPYIHRVLTLGTGKLVWRPIQNPLFPFHHVSGRSEICINGVVYYRAYFETSPSEIVCFNFSSERFGLINMDKDMLHDNEQRFTLFNYKGQLGAYQRPPSSYWCNEECVFWVLEDAGKHKWSKRSCKLPFWGDEILYRSTTFVGMTGTGELVFSQLELSKHPFYIFYYNIERNTFARFEIKGFEEFKHKKLTVTDVHTYLDYVENLKFM